MKAEVLKSGFQTITQVTNSPIMFAVKANVLYIGGHNETNTVVMTTSLEHDDFHFVLPPEHARQIAKTLKTGDVDIEEGTQDDTVVISSGRSKAVYTTMPIESISYKLLMHNYKEEFLYSIDGKLLADAFTAILPFSNSDVDDARVKNLHFSIEKDTVEVVASNNFTIAKFVFPAEKNYGNGDFPIKLVAKSFAFMGKTFGEFVEIGLTPKKMHYKSTDGTFTYKVTLPLVDVPPFPYRPLFTRLETDTNATEILLDKDEFLEKGRNFLYFTDEDIRNRVKITYDKTMFLIEGNNARGTFDLELTPVSSTASGNMFVSLDYLTKAANSVSSGEIAFKMVDNKILASDSHFSVLIPPLRN